MWEQAADELLDMLAELRDSAAGSLSRQELETLAEQTLDFEWERQVRPIEILYYSHKITEGEKHFLVGKVIEKFLGRPLPPANRSDREVSDVARRQELVQLVQQVEETPAERAQQLIYDYIQTSIEGETREIQKRKRVARQALKLCSKCADAYLLLATAIESPAEAVSWSEKALHAAEEVLGKALIEELAGRFVSVALARPYLRARDQLARALWDAGRRDEAIEHAEAILKLNPSDILETRIYLLNWYLRLQMTDKAGELLNRYLPDGHGPDSQRTSVAYDGALWLFQKEGASPAAREALQRAILVNPYVVGVITETIFASAFARDNVDEALEPMQRLQGEAEREGSESELAADALDYFNDHLSAWIQTPGALEWLAQLGVETMLNARGVKRASRAETGASLGTSSTSQDETHPRLAVSPDMIYQLKITLSGSKPPIWRRVLVPANATFADLNDIILEAMGWLGGHLWEFEVGDELYGPRSEDLDWSMEPPRDARKTRLYQVLGSGAAAFRHMYDFGDGWVHNVRVEKVLAAEPGVGYPRCVAGKRACPPEDCGGIWRYYELLKIAADPSHPEYKETVEWLGPGRLDPERFDVAEADAALEYVRRRLSRREARAQGRRQAGGRAKASGSSQG
ncbi:MAG: tetratricopeptide repeat protein [Limnochordaceae bacterium]|nr:tetratricopeptide repeat protein [Limnochordaceae bacterium]